MVDPAHLCGVIFDPTGGVGPRHSGGITEGECADQRLFHLGYPIEQSNGVGGRLVCLREYRLELGFIECVPRLVVVRPKGMRDSPICHGAIRVGFQRASKASYRLAVVEPVAP